MERKQFTFYDLYAELMDVLSDEEQANSCVECACTCLKRADKPN